MANLEPARRQAIASRVASALPWAGLLLLAAGLRLAGIGGTSLWHDEIMSIHTARMGVVDQLFRMTVANNQPPLYFLLLKIWAMVSWSQVWLRLLSVGMSLIGVVYAIRWGRLFNPRCGLLAGLLVATSPMMVHYAQEVRTYALLYTGLLAGLFYAERLARRADRRSSLGLLICVCLLSYAHYVGPMIGVGLWVYAWARGIAWQRIFRWVALWVLVTLPIIALGLLHAAHKVETGFWVPPIGTDVLKDLVFHLTGHYDLGLWQSAGQGLSREWTALLAWLAIWLGMLGALAAVPLGRRRDSLLAGLALIASGLIYGLLLIGFSVAVVPIALERTLYPALIPILGAMALSATGDVRWTRRVGTICCLLVSVTWAWVSIGRVFGPPERRQPEGQVFAAVAADFGPGDLLAVFPGNLQDSAAYFLGHQARAIQIHSPQFSRLQDTANGLRRLPVPRRENTDWLADLAAVADQLRLQYPQDHAVWMVDLGPRMFTDPRRQALWQWLRSNDYQPAQSYSTGLHWTLSARRYVPSADGPDPAQQHQEAD